MVKMRTKNHWYLVFIFLFTLTGLIFPWSESKFDRKLVKLFNLKRGMVVADVGAGKGEMTFLMAAEVSSEGRVYANEIKQHLIDKIQKGIKKQNLANVITILGEEDDPLLPEQVDFILLKFVYHHLSQPHTFIARIRRYLKKGGMLAVVAGDINSNPKYKDGVVPDPCISDPAETRAAIEKAGYIFLKRENLQGRRVVNYILFFKPAARRAPS